MKNEDGNRVVISWLNVSSFFPRLTIVICRDVDGQPAKGSFFRGKKKKVKSLTGKKN